MATANINPGVHRLMNYGDLRAAARSRLPRGLFEFIDRGTEDERALGDNVQALAGLKIVPRVLRDVGGVQCETTILGRTCKAPIIVAPTGAAGLAWHRGELALARAAAQEGVPFVLSTASLTPMEEIAEQAGGDLWFQLYIWPDREASYQLVERARTAGFGTLVVTVDTVVTPNREYNARNGFTIPMRPTLQNILDVSLHPRWAMGVFLRYLLTTGIPRHENYPEHLRQSLITRPKQSLQRAQTSTPTWQEIAQLRDRWPGKLVIKGILHPDDAREAARLGIDAVIVSNHGGRNLDSAAQPIKQLGHIKEAVGNSVEMLVDSGFTRGSDVVKALALGARGVLLGRMPLWGAAAGGEAGARRALSLVRDEMLRTLSFSGCASVHDLDRKLFG